MPQIETTYFGSLAWQPESAIEFPAGLPGFEDERSFVPLEIGEYAPLVFLQSVRTPGLCFLTLPVLAADPGYCLEAAPEDLARMGLDPRRTPVIGKDVLCLAVLTVAEDGITANLLAPIVIGLDSRRGVQAIQPQGRYSHRHALACEEAAVCS
jgi:flagellar assembly factor FliW